MYFQSEAVIFNYYRHTQFHVISVEEKIKQTEKKQTSPMLICLFKLLKNKASFYN